MSRCLVFALAAFVANAAQGVCEAGDATCKAGKKIVNYYPNKDYMERNKFGLDTILNQVNLAMSHDSGCRWEKYKGSGRKLTEKTADEIISHGAVTQDLSLADQFKAGVRVFDIRSDEDGVIYHSFGALQKHYKFANIQEEIYAFAVRVCLSEDFALFKFKGSTKAMEKVKDAIQNFAVGYTQDEAAQKVVEEFKKSKENVKQAIEDCQNQILLPAAEFDASTTTIRALQKKIVVMNDKAEKKEKSEWKKSMKLEKIEINAFKKWLGGVPGKLVEKFAKKCKKGGYLRLGFTHTGFPRFTRAFKELRSPLCMAYRNDDLIQEKIKEVLQQTIGPDTCRIIFSTDGTGDMLDKKHDVVDEKCPDPEK